MCQAQASLSDMLKLYLLRDYMTEDVTLGRIFNPDDNFHFQTLELPWLDNQINISCIPEGTYTCRRDFYNRGGYEAFEVTDVEGRSEIKFHIGNWVKDIKGCIAIGSKRYINNEPMITDSRIAFNSFMQYLEYKKISELELEIMEL